MQQKREKIRQLYDEIDKLDKSLTRSRDKSERSKIKRQLSNFRQEVTRLLEPEKKGHPQASFERTDSGPVTPRAEISPSNLPLGRGRVVTKALPHAYTNKAEDPSALQAAPKPRKKIPPKPAPQKTASSKKNIKRLEEEISRIQVQVISEAEKYRRAVRRGAPASKTVVKDLLRKKQRLEKELREAQGASKKRKRTKKPARQAHKKPVRTRTVIPEKPKTETKEEIRKRQERNAAYLKSFKSPENIRRYSAQESEGKKEKRYWWNEE